MYDRYCVGCVRESRDLMMYRAHSSCLICSSGSMYKARIEPVLDHAPIYPYGLDKDITVIINNRAYRPHIAELEQSAYEVARLNLEVRLTGGAPCVSSLRIKDVIFNPPATIVFWEDGKKTVVKAQNGEEFDPEKGLAMAIIKKKLGNQGNYFNHIKKWAKKYNATEKKEK